MPRTLISYVEDTPWFPSYKLHSLNPKQTFLLKSQTTGLVLFISLIRDTKRDTPEVNPPRNALQFLHLFAGNHELALPPTCSAPATSPLGLVYDVKRQSSPSCIPSTTSSLEGPHTHLVLPRTAMKNKHTPWIVRKWQPVHNLYLQT